MKKLLKFNLNATWLSNTLLIHFLIIGLASLILVLIWFRNGNILGAAEAELPFYKLNGFSTLTSWSWSDSYLGFATGLTTASFPSWWLLARIQDLGIPGFLIQAATFWMLFFAAGTGIYLLIKVLFPGLPRNLALMAVFFYWFNPLSLVNVWNRFLYNFMVFWALLPLVSFFFIKGLKQKRYNHALLTSLITLVFSYAFSSIIFTLLLWFWFLYIACFFVIFSEVSKKFTVKYILICLLSFILLHSWWISQYFSFIFSKSLSYLTVSFFDLEGNLQTLTSMSESLGKLVYSFRLLPGIVFDKRFGQVLIISTNFLGLVQFLFPVVILWLLYKYRKNFEVLLICSFYLLSLFLIKGTNEPYGEIFQLLFVKFLPLQAFRDPFEKFSFLLLLTTTLAFVFGLWKLKLHIKNPRIQNIVYYFFLFFILIVWGFPFVTSMVFTRASETTTKKFISYEVKVPDYYKKANDWFNDQNNDFRFISLPIAQEGMTYIWEKQYSGVELSRNLFDKPNISFNTTIPFYNSLVAEMSKYQLDRRLLQFLPFVNSKYIVLRSDVDFKDRKVGDPLILRKQLEELVTKGSINKSFENGKLSVYELDADFIWPKIYITPNILMSNQNDFTKIADLNSSFMYNPVAVVNYNQSSLDTSLKLNDYLIVPDKTFLPSLIYSNHKFTDQDLMARLFYVKHLPTEVFYPFIRFKEMMESPSRGDYLSWILYQTGILGKRAVEVYRLYNIKTDKAVVERAEKDYLYTLAYLKPHLITITSKNSLVSDVIKESLVYQYMLLQKVSTKESEKALADILLEENVIYKFELPFVKNTNYIIYHFTIPQSGNYYLNLDKKVDISKWFENGQSLKEIPTGNIIYLEKGVHEFAVNVLESDYLTDTFNLEKLAITDQSSYKTNFNFSDTPHKYKIDFDYLFRKGNSFQLDMVQNIDNKDSHIVSERIAKNAQYHDWSHQTIDFSSTAGALTGTLEVLPTTYKECSTDYLIIKSCVDKISKFEVELRNIKIRQLDFPQISLTARPNIESYPTSTTWKWVKINPATYALKISKKTPQTEAIVFSELFDPKWKLYKIDDNRVWSQAQYKSQWRGVASEFTKNKYLHLPKLNLTSSPLDGTHFLANLYANSWIIDTPGEYEFMLMFDPQRNYYIGAIVSVISTITIISYLLLKICLKTKGN